MQTYPNQKIITINKPKTNDNFAIYNTEMLFAACQNLSYVAFKIWLYAMSNQNGFTFALSKSDINKSLNIGTSQYKRAIKELTEKHYLIQNHKHKNHYYFYELPKQNIDFDIF